MTYVVVGLLIFGLFTVAVCVSNARSGGVQRGLAGGMDVVETMSAAAARRRALQVRPNTRTTWRTPPREVGREVGRRRWRWLYVSFQDVVLYVAPPRTGKTGALAAHVQDAPGAVLSTSTRVDLHELGAKSRSQRPSWVLNPRRIGGVDNTLRWNPIFGCRNPRRAMVTAAYFVSAGDSNDLNDGAFWESQAVRALRSLLAAADLDGADLHTLDRWRALDSDRPVDVLESHPDAPRGWAADLRELQGLDPKPRGSISSTMAACLQFLADDQLAHIATPALYDHFDVDHYLQVGGTVDVIGVHEPASPIGPLFAAFTGTLYERARDIGAASPGRRLDPPLSIVNDEAANTLRVSLPRWTSDGGGAGISISIAVQTRQQLHEAWGDGGAATIWDNATTKVVFGGSSDMSLLRDLSELTGTRAVEIGSKQRRPVLLPAEISGLRDGQALVITRGKAVIARVRMAWQRRHPPIAQPLVAEEPQDARNVVRLADRARKAA